jgi:hypothetical protein
VPADNSYRLDFEHLHPISEKVEGAALLLGLVVVALMGYEDGYLPQPGNETTR